jgi:hypothetical protein
MSLTQLDLIEWVPALLVSFFAAGRCRPSLLDLNPGRLLQPGKALGSASLIALGSVNRAASRAPESRSPSGASMRPSVSRRRTARLIGALRLVEAAVEPRRRDLFADRRRAQRYSGEGARSSAKDSSLVNFGEHGIRDRLEPERIMSPSVLTNHGAHDGPKLQLTFRSRITASPSRDPHGHQQFDARPRPVYSPRTAALSVEQRRLSLADSTTRAADTSP